MSALAFLLGGIILEARARCRDRGLGIGTVIEGPRSGGPACEAPTELAMRSTWEVVSSKFVLFTFDEAARVISVDGAERQSYGF